MSLSLFIQGIAGAEGPPGKDGLVGERVRLNTWCACCFFKQWSGCAMHTVQLCVLNTDVCVFTGRQG